MHVLAMSALCPGFGTMLTNLISSSAAPEQTQFMLRQSQEEADARVPALTRAASARPGSFRLNGGLPAAMGAVRVGVSGAGPTPLRATATHGSAPHPCSCLPCCRRRVLPRAPSIRRDQSANSATTLMSGGSGPMSQGSTPSFSTSCLRMCGSLVLEGCCAAAWLDAKPSSSLAIVSRGVLGVRCRCRSLVAPRVRVGSSDGDLRHATAGALQQCAVQRRGHGRIPALRRHVVRCQDPASSSCRHQRPLCTHGRRGGSTTTAR